MTTLFDLTHRLASELGIVVGGNATGGSTTTLIDTTLLDQFPDEYFQEGTLWIVYDAGATGAAPQGEYGVVTTFNPMTQTVTLAAALTTAVASGDAYKLAPASYPLWALRDAINRALDEIGLVEVFDGTSLTGTASQTEYTLPAANITVKRVYLQGITSDSNDNRWYETVDWSIIKTASGSADLLVLGFQPQVDHKIGILYTKVHPQLYLYNSTVDERVYIPHLVARAAQLCVERKMFDGNPDPGLKMQYELLTVKVKEMAAETPRPPGRRVRLFTDWREVTGRREEFMVNP